MIQLCITLISSKMKRFFTFIIAAICGISAFAYDFSAVSNSGHTLYYNITSNTAPYTVEVTYPSYDNSTNYYQGYSKPSGNLVIPETVANNAITYSVTSISDNAFTPILLQALEKRHLYRVD